MATSNLRFRIIGDDDASATFLKVAASAKLLKTAMDDISGAPGIRLAPFTALVPVAAAAAGAVTELGVAFGAAAGAGGVFGLSVAGFLKDMFKQQQSIAATQKSLDGATKGTQTYRDTLAKLHTQQQAFNKEFGPAAKGFYNMKAAFSSFLDATGPVTKGVLAKGFNLIAAVLPRLVPVSNAAGKAIGGLLDDLRHWVNGPEFAAVLHWLKTSGPAAITAFGRSIGNLVVGVGRLLANFVGPGDNAVQTLLKLTRAFKSWAGSKGVSDSVRSFLNYMSDNGPTITKALQSLAQAAPKVAVALGQLGSLNLTVTTAFLNLIAGLPQGAFNAVVDGLMGIYVAAKLTSIAMLGLTVIQGVSTAMSALNDACIATRFGLMALFVVEKAGAIWTGVLTAAQWALNVAMDANPIGAIVIALELLVVGLILAYKHSATFRAVVQGAWAGIESAAKAAWPVIRAAFEGMSKGAQAVGKVAIWLWNGAFQPAFRFIINGVATLLNMWGKMLGVLGHVPGFGWAKSASQAMYDAANKAHALANSIRDIPTSHDVNINIYTHHIGVHGQSNPDLAGMGGGSSGGASMFADPRRFGKGVGTLMIEGLADGIGHSFVRLTTAFGRVTAYLQSQRQKLSSLTSARDSFASGFQSFATSIFGASYGQDANGNEIAPTVATILALQGSQAKHAHRVNKDVHKLIKMGLSKSLIKQLQSQGESGFAEIAALAGASPAQIRRLNALNSRTQGQLHSAGMFAGDALYGRQIVQTRNNIDLAKRIAHELRQDDHHGKNEYVVVKVDGHEIVRAIRKDKRTKGKTSAV